MPKTRPIARRVDHTATDLYKLRLQLTTAVAALRDISMLPVSEEGCDKARQRAEAALYSMSTGLW